MDAKVREVDLETSGLKVRKPSIMICENEQVTCLLRSDIPKSEQEALDDSF